MKQFDKSAWEAYLQALQIINKAVDQLQVDPSRHPNYLALTILDDAAEHLRKQWNNEVYYGRP